MSKPVDVYGVITGYLISDHIVYTLGPKMYIVEEVKYRSDLQSIPIYRSENDDFPKKWWFSKKMMIFQKNDDFPKKSIGDLNKTL